MRLMCKKETHNKFRDLCHAHGLSIGGQAQRALNWYMEQQKEHDPNTGIEEYGPYVVIDADTAKVFKTYCHVRELKISHNQDHALVEYTKFLKKNLPTFMRKHAE